MTKRNSEIARKFAGGAYMGYNKHMFIEGSGIYSYSHSFPIAKRFKNIFLMNSDGYSSTTKHHKMLVFHALNANGKTIIFLPNCDIQRAYQAKEMNEKRMHEFREKLIRARTRQDYYTSGIRNFKEQNKLIDEMIIPHVIAEKL